MKNLFTAMLVGSAAFFAPAVLDAQMFTEWSAPVNLGPVINTASGEV